eukprot:3755272-Prymnesium_polylepis.1
MPFTTEAEISFSDLSSKQWQGFRQKDRSPYVGAFGDSMPIYVISDSSEPICRMFSSRHSGTISYCIVLPRSLMSWSTSQTLYSVAWN